MKKIIYSRMKDIKLFCAFSMLACALGLGAGKDAWAGPSHMDIQVRFAVYYVPYCWVQDVAVDFGNGILPSSIDGAQHEVDIPIVLSNCSFLGGGGANLKLGLIGDLANFGDGLLKTSKDGLAIEARKDNSKIAINTWKNFSLPSAGTWDDLGLTAVLVKNPGAVLGGGPFTASATFLLEYQ